MNYFQFLREKIKGYSLRTLLFLEVESLCFGALSLIPTTVGVFLRGIAFRLMAQHCGGFAWIQPRVMLIHADRISVGKNFGVNTGSYLNGVGYIEIGNFVLIGDNVTISSGMHPIDRCDIPVFSRSTIPKKIVIENDVWIGAGAVIMAGVRLRQGTVVGANSVVTRDTEAYTVVVGAPARAIRRRYPDA